MEKTIGFKVNDKTYNDIQKLRKNGTNVSMVLRNFLTAYIKKQKGITA